MARRAARAWVVSHGEIVLTPGDYLVDEVVLFTASSKQGALRMIRQTHVDPGSWWRVDCTFMDRPEQMGGRSLLYSHRAREIAAVPLKQAYRGAIVRDRKALESMRERLAEARRTGGSKKMIRVFSQAIRYMSRCLSRNRHAPR